MKSVFDIPNKTYYGTTDSRVVNSVFSASSFSAYQQRRKDVIQRLTAEFEHTKELGGATYFYTFTYSELKIPKFHGVNVHDYRHLREFLVSSGFTLCLKRYFNASIKYCITSEFGEGKGRRGYHNNPHYHALFFVVPIDASKPIITALEFNNLVKSYWQGISVSAPTYKHRIDSKYIVNDKNLMKYGFAQAGNNCGYVTDIRAVMYVAKYVTKDSSTVYAERAIKNTIDSYVNFELDDDGSLWQMALDNYHSVCTEYGVADEDFLLFGDTTYLHHRKSFAHFLRDFKAFICTQEIEKYNKFHKVRFRASQGLGDSIFTSSKFDKNDATIVRTSVIKGQFCNITEKITGQLYRKWFYKVDRQLVFSKSQMKWVTNNFYRPNGNLLKYRESHFDEAFSKHKQLVDDTLNELKDVNLFTKIAKSHFFDLICANEDKTKDINLLIRQYYDRFITTLFGHSIGCDGFQPSARIALYDFVYRNRSYDSAFECEIHPKDDFIRFQKSSFYAKYQVKPLYDYLQSFTNIFNLISYEHHPYFESIMPYYEIYRRYSDFRATEQASRWFAEEEHRRRCRQLVQGLSRQY